MVAVTVTGAHGKTVTLQFDSAANAALAKTLAAQISAGIAGGVIAPATNADGPPPPLAPGKIGEFVAQNPGAALLTPGYRAFVGAASNMTVFGSDDANESILAGSGNLTFTAFAGSGTIVSGGGRTNVFIGASDSGDWSLFSGKGSAQIEALGSGNDYISAGSGSNGIALGAGNDTVISSGNDTVQAGAGASTIIAEAGARDLIYGGSGKMLFVGGSGPATVFGGTGSTTIFGGDGASEFHGGSAGNNSIFAGTGAATLFGAGNGDFLQAAGSRGQALFAGAGAETLNGVFSSGADTLAAGSGNTVILGGSGADTLVAGTGNATMQGGIGKDFFEFIKGDAGGTVTILDFTSTDKVGLSGYGEHAIAWALATQSNAGGSTTLTLSDMTKITFVGVSHLGAGSFASMGSESDDGACAYEPRHDN